MYDGRVTGEHPIYYCQLFKITAATIPDVELFSETPYVIDLKGSINLLKGSYAPIGLQTRMSENVLKDVNNKGPILDTNPVFDMIYVID